MAAYNLIDLIQRDTCLVPVDALLDIALQLFIDPALLRRIFSKDKVSILLYKKCIRRSLCRLAGPRLHTQRLNLPIRANLSKKRICKILKFTSAKLTYSGLDLCDSGQ